MKDKPAISKLTNMDTKPWAWGAHFLVLIFTVIGIAFIVYGYKWGKNFIKSLIGGIVTDAFFTHCEEVKGSDSPSWNNYYKFEDELGNLFFTFENNAMQKGFENQKVIYQKNNPKENQILNFDNINLLFSKGKLEIMLLYTDF
jgi:hypothetical protein